MSRTRHSIPISVAVAVSDVLRGVFEIDGLLTLEEDSLVIEYRSTGVPELNANTDPLQSFRIQFDDLQDIEYKEHIVRASVILRPRSLRVIEDMPGDHGAELKLTVRRKYRSRAAELVADAQIASARSRSSERGSIPFSLPSATQNFSEVGGLIYLDDEFLVFEIQSGLPGGSRNKDQIVKIEPRALSEISLNTSLLKDMLCIRPKKQELLDVLPGDRVDAVRLKINNTYRAEAKRLIAAVQSRMTPHAPGSTAKREEVD